MTKKGNKVVVELQLNSSAPISERELRRGFQLPKTQQSLCAIENSAILESYARADASPSDKAEALKLAREWHQKNLFVQVGLNLKVAFSNYGFRLKPVDKISDADRLKLQTWYRKWKQPILRFVRETWEDWHILDNAVAFWRKQGETIVPHVITLKPEDCTYSDAMGVEKLKVRLGWSKEELTVPDQKPVFKREEWRRYASREITLSGHEQKYDGVRCAQFGLWRGARRAHPRSGL